MASDVKEPDGNMHQALVMTGSQPSTPQPAPSGRESSCFHSGWKEFQLVDVQRADEPEDISK